MAIDVGDAERLRITLRDEAGVLATPSALTLAITSPGGVVTTKAIGELTNDSTGVYSYVVTVTEAGRWRYKFASTSPTVVEESALYVRATSQERSNPYATLEDVEGLMAGVTFSATSRPSENQVYRYLAERSDELDAALGVLDYQTPIATAATQALSMVRTWTTVGAAYRAAMAMPQGKDSKHAEAYGKEWTAILTSVEGGKRQLPDAARRGTKSPRSGSPDTCAPTFNRGNAQTLR